MREMYQERELGYRQIADRADCGLKTIQRWMKNHGIESRNPEDYSRQTGEDNANWKGGKPSCDECGKEISWQSEKCIDCYTSNISGENNPNYKGKANLNGILRTKCKNHWRPKVFARDGYECKKCGDDSGGNLNAHHIRPFYKIVDEYLDTNNIDATEMSAKDRITLAENIYKSTEISNIDNGVTLCGDCHDSVHSGEFGLPGRSSNPEKRESIK